MFGGFSRHFRHVSISKSDEARAEQQARLIAMPSRGCYFSEAKERFYIFIHRLSQIDTDYHHQSVISNQSSLINHQSQFEPKAHNLCQSVLICGQPKPRAASGSVGVSPATYAHASLFLRVRRLYVDVPLLFLS